MLLTHFSLEPFKQRLTCFALCGLIVGIIFFSLYPVINWLTSLRDHTLGLYLTAELTIPFVPQMIWIYLTMYLMLFSPLWLLNSSAMRRLSKNLVLATLVAAIVYILLPCHLGFARTIPSEPMYADLFKFLFQLDYPHNLVPSLHVIYASTIVLAVTITVKKWLKGVLYGWLFLLMCSTLLVHQHHLIDVVTGLLLSLIIHQRSGRNYEKDYYVITDSR